MTLCRSGQSTNLGGNESDLLLALIAGVTEKEQLISRVWGQRGWSFPTAVTTKPCTCFARILPDVGLPRDSLKTLPRRGVVLLCEIRLVNAELAEPESVIATPASDEPAFITVTQPSRRY